MKVRGSTAMGLCRQTSRFVVMRKPFLVLTIVAALGVATCVRADKTLTIDSVDSPGPNKPDEPLAEIYSFSRGVHFLQSTASRWSKQRKCVTCHTNGLALAAQPVIAPGSKTIDKGRTFASEYIREYVEVGKKPRGQRGAVEGLVATTAFLALSDARTGVGVQPATALGLAYSWEALGERGTWEDWLQCNWPPFETDLAFGPTLMLVGLGELNQLGEKSGLTDADRAGAVLLLAGLAKRPPSSLHDKAMRLWAGRHWPKLGSREERTRWKAELLAAQSGDGGWSMAAIAGKSWRRDDGSPQAKASEAYPTAFATYVLLQTDDADHAEHVERGLAWLRANQRASGRWFTRSPRKDGRHYISHAATAFALMCLADRPGGDRIRGPVR